MASSSLYSGVASAQRAIQNLRYVLFCLHSFSLKQTRLFRPLVAVHMSPMKPDDDQNANLIVEVPSPVKYHAWDMKYHQIHTRETSRKSMTKESYTQKSQVFLHAKESIATEEECELELIPPEAIQARQPIIHGEDKVPCELD